MHPAAASRSTSTPTGSREPRHVHHLDGLRPVHPADRPVDWSATRQHPHLGPPGRDGRARRRRRDCRSACWARTRSGDFAVLGLRARGHGHRRPDRRDVEEPVLELGRKRGSQEGDALDQLATPVTGSLGRSRPRAELPRPRYPMHPSGRRRRRGRRGCPRHQPARPRGPDREPAGAGRRSDRQGSRRCLERCDARDLERRLVRAQGRPELRRQLPDPRPLRGRTWPQRLRLHAVDRRRPGADHVLHPTGGRRVPSRRQEPGHDADRHRPVRRRLVGLDRLLRDRGDCVRRSHSRVDEGTAGSRVLARVGALV